MAESVIVRKPLPAAWNPEYLNAVYEAAVLDTKGKPMRGSIGVRGNVMKGTRLLCVAAFLDDEDGKPIHKPAWYDIKTGKFDGES